MISRRFSSIFARYVEGVKEQVHSSSVPADALKRRLYYRCKRMGTLEVEVLLMRYLDQKLPGMDAAQVHQFDKEVVQLENPVLSAYLLKGTPLAPEHDTPLLSELQTFVRTERPEL